METQNNKREQLREISKKAKTLQETDFPDLTINEILIEKFYKDKNNQEFKTLWDWNKEGYNINKGEKAFLIWGSPKPIKNKVEATKENNQEEDNDEFFPLCFLFSNSQVTKKNVKE